MKKTREQIQDELLALRCQTRDVEAFEELVNRWQERLWRWAYRTTEREDAAWDVVQDSWAAIVKGISRLEDPASFPKWAFRIVTNKCADWVRKRQKHRQLSDKLDAETNPADSGTGVSPGRYDALEHALDTLNPDQRALLSLRYVEGFDVAEIAGILSIPIGTVKSRLHTARQQVRRTMEQCPDE